MANLENLSQLIPPAIFIAGLVFLVKFFGKAVSDQRPFADDRDWQRELDGINFFTYQILNPIFGLFILISKNFNPFRLNRYDLLITLIALIVFFVLNNVIIKSNIFLLKNRIEDDKKKIILHKFLFTILSVLLVFLLTYFYSNGMYFYLIFGLIYFFIYLIGLAVLDSLKNENIFVANIYLTNSEVYENFRIMKVNDDNVRIVKDKKVIILNKSLISKIEQIKMFENLKNGTNRNN